MNTNLRIAVVGGGVAGLVAARGLDRLGHDITLLEANHYVGGHTNTIEVEGEGGVAVDTGFITFNDRTYPRFIAWLGELGIAGRVSDMSFGYQCRLSGLAYGGHNLDTFFAQRRNLANPDFLRLAIDIARFNSAATAWVRLPHPPELGTVQEFAARFSRGLLRHYLMPLGAAIWSAPPGQMADFPASMFLRFFHNHGLLSVFDRPVWRTVPGGSFRYVQAFLRQFGGRAETSCEVEQVRRFEDRVEVRCAGEWRAFDRLVLACHADQALRLLGDDADELERKVLSPWHYQPNQAVLHTDERVLPTLKKVRSSWNYVRESLQSERATLTYDMNRLQGLETRRRYLVTLNPATPIAETHTIGAWLYHHPAYTAEALASQARLPELQQRRHTYFCGSYFGFGFHEDAVVSAESLVPLCGGVRELARV